MYVYTLVGVEVTTLKKNFRMYILAGHWTTIEKNTSQSNFNRKLTGICIKHVVKCNLYDNGANCGETVCKQITVLLKVLSFSLYKYRTEIVLKLHIY